MLWRVVCGHNKYDIESCVWTRQVCYGELCVDTTSMIWRVVCGHDKYDMESCVEHDKYNMESCVEHDKYGYRELRRTRQVWR